MSAPRVVCFAVFLGACTGTPMPAPPIDPPPVPDIERIIIEPPLPTSPGRLIAGPGTVAPGTQLFVVNLDTVDDAQILEVMADGSFVVETQAGTTRLESIDADGLRSAPLDLDESGAVEVMLSCLVIPSQLEVGGSLRVENRCPDEVSAQVALRREGTFEVSVDRIALPAGQTITIEVSAAPPVVADVLFLFVESPSAERRAVTLF